MKKIKYNISKSRKTDFFKFSLFASILFIISISLIIVSTHNIVSNKRRYQNELKKLNSIEESSENLSKKRAEYKNIIEKIKREWNDKVKLVNGLIFKKNFSYIKKLNMLEDLLPIGVYINNISLNIASKSNIRFDIVAYSYSNLMNAYKILKKHDQNLSITGEKQSDDQCSASLKIQLKDETH